MTWPERWRAVLGDGGHELERRVRQGVATYRSGRVSDVRLDIGRVSARVQGSRATPFLVEIGIPTLTREEWEIVLDLLASTVRYSARLLAGQHPEGLEEEAEAAGVRLFPRRDEISVAAGHSGEDPFPVAGAAVWEAVGVRLDSGPFPLLQLRGRGRDRILRDIARRRRSSDDTAAAGVPVEQVSPRGWTQPSASLDSISIPRVTVPRLSVPGLRVLGEPDGWAGALSPADLFGPLVTDGADAAVDLLEGRPAEEE
ncbi:hypothetical protein [Euzebya tangerina]|uniref:SWIM zinc finger family protein n=1 Tax=Euzebya tangerina TaxID=591198 RepID=UPI000E312230|nr:hypothetical protein [Euzebya tangerina]